MAKLATPVTAALADGRAVTVRAVRRGDARALARMLDAVAAEPEATLLLLPGQVDAGAWRRRIAAALADPHTLLLVATVDGELAGNLGLHPDPHPAAAHVRWLGMSVAAGWRGVGMGSVLLETAVAWAARQGVRRVVLSVFPHNVGAVAFYEGHGFVREGLRRGQLRRGDEYHDEVLMARTLIDEAPA